MSDQFKLYWPDICHSKQNSYLHAKSVEYKKYLIDVQSPRIGILVHQSMLCPTLGRAGIHGELTWLPCFWVGDFILFDINEAPRVGRFDILVTSLASEADIMACFSNGHLFLAVILIIHSQTQQTVFLTWVSDCLPCRLGNSLLGNPCTHQRVRNSIRPKNTRGSGSRLTLFFFCRPYYFFNAIFSESLRAAHTLCLNGVCCHTNYWTKLPKFVHSRYESLLNIAQQKNAKIMKKIFKKTLFPTFFTIWNRNHRYLFLGLNLNLGLASVKCFADCLYQMNFNVPGVYQVLWENVYTRRQVRSMRWRLWINWVITEAVILEKSQKMKLTF